MCVLDSDTIMSERSVKVETMNDDYTLELSDWKSEEFETFLQDLFVKISDTY